MSDQFNIDFGPWINYGKNTVGDKVGIGDQMEELKSMPWSPFNGCDYAQIFIYCMAYAFAKGRTPKNPPGNGSMPGAAFKKDMRDFMKIVAIEHTKELEIITKPNEVVKICEGYAYAGFPEVYDFLKNKPKDKSPEIMLEEILHEIKSENNS